MTVEDAKIEAQAMQQALDMGVKAVDQKIEQRRNEPAQALPQVEEKDDGHEETVEEVKAKMAAAQAAMDQGLDSVNKKAEDDAKTEAMMPNMSALTNMAGSMHKMGLSQKQR